METIFIEEDMVLLEILLQQFRGFLCRFLGLLGSPEADVVRCDVDSVRRRHCSDSPLRCPNPSLRSQKVLEEHCSTHSFVVHSFFLSAGTSNSICSVSWGASLKYRCTCSVIG
jgi:hypothetical protein